MDDDEINRAVLAYLNKKGFNREELALEEDQNKSLSSSAPPTHPESQRGSVKYQEEYDNLRSWAYGSLDLYKRELLNMLYPVFIHCFMDLVAKGNAQEARSFFNSFREDHEMMHLRDLQKLEGVLSPSHLEDMEYAHSLRQSKMNIRICKYSYELLVEYLQKMKSISILGIVNEHINFRVYSGQPGLKLDDIEDEILFGNNQDAALHINKKEVRWGLLKDSFEERLEKVVSDSEKSEGDGKEVDLEETKKRLVEGGKQKKLKKDKSVGAIGKNARSETNSITMPPRMITEPAVPVMPTEVEKSILEDLRNRVKLNSLALPSVSFYTFINTQNCLNCLSISHDGSLVAGGFSDASLKVWDMSKIGQANMQKEHESAANENALGSGEGRKSYTLLQGHAGPVYSATFSPLGDFILSSSSDSTIRLWSTKLNANLVCYKGHNYPVWDVQFSPLGNYFASASHDRTARIWSMDRIQPLRILAGHLSDVDCVQWHVNCNYIATGSSDKTVRLWDAQSGECVRIFIGHRSMILSLAMSPDGRFMASGDEDGTIMMWDISSGRCVQPLLGHSGCVWTLAFSCEGTLLASGSADCTVKMWDITASAKVARTEENSKTGNSNRLRLLKTLPTRSTPVYSLQFSRRNLLFASGVFSK
ncbi:hypothetical protein QJS10_CPB19g00693 [Acorus calamus]|uniref:TFIID subunit TAF5 NTD2 domain-containing protein n=1 Tax=Acorus calamus TaxID=4465 RepID=A0AAV9CJ96_ACOCL|nr:hypothetical protein QJS10_CPB19g00693 [Acorus calamus]